MARRHQKTSVIEDLVDIISRLPWWVGCLLAVISFVVLHHIAGTKPPMPAGMGDLGSAMGRQIGVIFATFGQIILPAVFVIGSLISLIKTLRQPKPKTEPLPWPVENLAHLPAEELPAARPQSSVPHAWSLPILVSLEWKRFETVCSEYFRLIGYDARETRIGADGGVDIRISKPWENSSDTIVQCKAWSTYKVGVKPLRELYGVMSSENVTQGMFMATGDFTTEALDFAKGKKLELYSGQRLLAEIKKLPEQWQKGLLEVALEGDYTTPTCPQCGVKMTLRAGKGERRDFWGCPRYPRCKATLVSTAQVN